MPLFLIREYQALNVLRFLPNLDLLKIILIKKRVAINYLKSSHSWLCFSCNKTNVLILTLKGNQQNDLFLDVVDHIWCVEAKGISFLVSYNSFNGGFEKRFCTFRSMKYLYPSMKIGVTSSSSLKSRVLLKFNMP